MGFLEEDKGIIAGDRGWVLLPVEDSEIEAGLFKNPHLASIEPSRIRGNHFHEQKTEYIYIFGGSARVAIQDLNFKKDARVEEIESHSPVLLKVEPKVAHAIKNIGQKTIYLFCYGTKGYDPNNPDVEGHMLLG